MAFVEDDELDLGFVDVSGDLAQLFESLALGLFYGRAGGDGGEVVVAIVVAVICTIAIEIVVNHVFAAGFVRIFVHGATARFRGAG